MTKSLGDAYSELRKAAERLNNAVDVEVVEEGGTGYYSGEQLDDIYEATVSFQQAQVEYYKILYEIRGYSEEQINEELRKKGIFR